MKNFYITYTFKNSEAREAFVEKVKPLAEITRREPGCIRYDYYYPVGSETELFLWEQWQTAQHQKDHTERSHFADIIALKEKCEAETEIEVSETK